MDLDAIIRELLDERKRLDRMIQALEQGTGDSPGKPPRSPRGRKSMDHAARQEVSERMKQYWAKRREQRLATPAGFSTEDKAASTAA